MRLGQVYTGTPHTVHTAIPAALMHAYFAEAMHLRQFLTSAPAATIFMRLCACACCMCERCRDCALGQAGTPKHDHVLVTSASSHIKRLSLLCHI